MVIIIMNMNNRVILNILLIIVIIYQWLKMFLGKEAMLADRGFESLKYFTVLSNLFEALASLIWLFNQNEKLKYVAAVCLTLTFITVMVFLGPLFGFEIMFVGPNLWFHLFIPLIAIFELIFCNQVPLNKTDNIYAILPMFIYGLFYTANVFINGMGSKNKTNDWYGFFSWGKPFGFVIYFIITIATYLIALALRILSNHF